VIARRSRLTIQCPAFRRALSFGLVILALSACGYIPRPVEGVPPGAPWEALPLRKWLAEDRAEPQALAFCAPPECRPGLVVSVIDLKGRDADISEAVLKDPARLASAIGSHPRDGSKPHTIVTAHPIADSTYRGFAISLAPSDGSKSPAYGAAFGLRTGETLKLVLVIGDDEPSVLATLRQVAERELKL
jgi:hypothetical protein